MKLRAFSALFLLAAAGLASATTYRFRVTSPGVVSVTPLTLGAFTVPNLTAGGAAVALTPPSSNSAGAFTFSSSNPAVASVSGNMLAPVGGGTATITATQAAYGLYPSGSTTATVTVLYMPTLGALSVPATVYAGEPSFALTQPTSNSTGAFTYSSSNPSVASVSGNRVTPLSAGTTTITATQAAAGGYGAASTSAALTVQAALPNVVWGSSTNPAITFGADGISAIIGATNSGLVRTNAAGTKTTATSPGKWYWEITPTAGEVKNLQISIYSETGYAAGVAASDNTGTNGSLCPPGSCSATPTAAYRLNDVIGVAYNAVAKEVTFYRNGAVMGYTMDLSGKGTTWTPALQVKGTSAGATYTANFGSKPFVYTPPSGFVKLEP